MRRSALIAPLLLLSPLWSACRERHAASDCQSTPCEGSKTRTYETCGDGTSAQSVLRYSYGDLSCTFTLGSADAMTVCAEAVAAWCQSDLDGGRDHKD